jgi:hypothetical protein
MSVAKNSFGLAPYYDYKIVNPNRGGLEANYVRCSSASPTKIVAFGQVRSSLGTTISNGLWSSSNAIDWAQITTAPNTAIYDVAYGNNTFVAVGAAGVIYTSSGTDAGTWTARTKAGNSTNNFTAIRFAGGYFIATQQSGTVQSSTDGITWTLNLNNGILTPGADADNLGQYDHSLVFEKGSWTWFNGATSSTASARVYFADLSSISGTAFNNSVSDSGVYKYARNDIGDGLGAFLQYSSTAATFVPQSRISRISFGNISASFQTSNWTQPHSNVVYSSLQNTGPFSSTVLASGNIYTTNIAFNGFYYDEGWYTTVFPAAVDLQRTNNGTSSTYYGVGAKTYHETDATPEVAGVYAQNRTKVLPGFLASANNIQGFFQYTKDLPSLVNGKRIILLNNPAGVNGGGIIAIVGTRAFRQVRTTIDYLK